VNIMDNTVKRFAVSNLVLVKEPGSIPGLGTNKILIHCEMS